MSFPSRRLTAAGVVALALGAGPALAHGSSPAASRLTADAMSGGPGTVVVEKFKNTQGLKHPSHSSQTIVTLTPSGSGPEQILNAGAPVGKVTGTAVLGPDEEVYTASTNTIYTSSIWAPYIHRTSSGGYVYREGPGAFLNGLRSFPLTPSQAAGLRAGRLQIEVNAQGKWHVGPVLRAATATQTIVRLLREHAYRYDGRTTLNGRTVQKFSGPRWNPSPAGMKQDPHDLGGVVLYVDPTTHLPVEQTVTRGALHSQQVWTEYKVLPLNSRTRRLVTLQHMYPTAKVIHNHAAYVKASHGVAVFTGF